jgi:EmrB/QacA subfamily drug resistance transporter
MTGAVVTPEQRRTILGALLLVLLLSALDQTIVSTAMPRIIEQLKGLEFYAWVTTAYMLTSTVSVPIYGKLSDLYGRKPILVFGIVLFLVGSVLCGLSGEFGTLPVLGTGMTQLIVFRGLQGLGSGALFMSAFVTIADLYSPLERGKAMGVFGAAFGLASIVGPAIGGFFTDHGTFTLLGHVVAGWRWVFYVNLPLGLIALGVVMAKMPTLHHGATGRIDFPGAALVILTFVPLLLALSFGGSKYAWDSAEIRQLFAISVIAFVAFIIVELRTANPIVPLSLFRNRVVSACASSGFLIGMIFFSVVMFMPLYMQVVLGVSATSSGLAMLPLMIGLIVGSIGSGRLVARIGRYKPFIIGGIALLGVGMFLLTQVGPETSLFGIDWRLALIGLGLGPTQSLFNMAVQNAVSKQETGVATSTMQFCRQIGSTVGVAVFGTLLTQHLTTELHARVPPVPGEQVIEKIDLGVAQSMAMNAGLLSQRVDSAMERRYADIEVAYRGDSGAASRLLAEADLPPDIRRDLEQGGLQPAIRGQLDTLARKVEQGLLHGEAGRSALLADPGVPPGLRAELAEVPTRALQNPDAMKGVVARYREAILAQEAELVAAAQAQRLAAVREALTEQGRDLAARIDQGTRAAFSTSIINTFVIGLFIVLGALLLAGLIPELPLKTRTSASPAPAEG